MKTRKRIQQHQIHKSLKSKKSTTTKPINFLTNPCNTQNKINVLFCVKTVSSLRNKIPLFQYKKRKGNYTFHLNSKKYTISFNYKMGSGSYATTWKSTYISDTHATDIIVKRPIIDIDKNSFLHEIFIHLLLFCSYKKYSSTLGYIPEIKVIFRTTKTNILYGMESLDGTLWDFISDNLENQQQIYIALKDIVSFLNDLQIKYKLMHRDFHPGNIMYKKNKKNYQWYFIDFNMCFLTINNKQINEMTKTKHYHIIHTFNPTHDIRLLFLYIYEHYMNRLPHMLLHYILSLFENVAHYFPNIKKKESSEYFFTNHAYGDIVHEYDENFHPKNVLQYLQAMIQNEYTVTKVEINKNIINNNNIFNTYIQTSRNLLNIYL